MLLVQRSRSTSPKVATIPLIFIKHSMVGITSKRYKSPQQLENKRFVQAEDTSNWVGFIVITVASGFGVIDWFPPLAVRSFQAAHVLSGLVMLALSQLQRGLQFPFAVVRW